MGLNPVQSDTKVSSIRDTFFTVYPKKQHKVNTEFTISDFNEIVNNLFEEKTLAEVKSKDYKKSSKYLVIKPDKANKDSLKLGKLKIGKLVAWNYSSTLEFNDFEADEVIAKAEKVVLNNATIQVLKTRGYTEISGNGKIGLLVNIDGSPVKVANTVSVDNIGVTSNARITADFTNNKPLFQTNSAPGFQTNVPTAWFKDYNLRTGFDMKKLVTMHGVQEYKLKRNYNLDDGIVFDNKMVEYKGKIEDYPSQMKMFLSKIAEQPAILTFIPKFDDGSYGIPSTIIPPFYFTYRDSMSPYAPVKVYYISESLVPQYSSGGKIQDMPFDMVRGRHTGNIFTMFEFQPDAENIAPTFRLTDYQKELGLFSKPIEIKESKK